MVKVSINESIRNQETWDHYFKERRNKDWQFDPNGPSFLKDLSKTWRSLILRFYFLKLNMLVPCKISKVLECFHGTTRHQIISHITFEFQKDKEYKLTIPWKYRRYNTLVGADNGNLDDEEIKENHKEREREKFLTGFYYGKRN